VVPVRHGPGDPPSAHRCVRLGARGGRGDGRPGKSSGADAVETVGLELGAAQAAVGA